MRGKGCPEIGNNVVLCPGSQLTGDIRIGDYCFIGPGAVVTKDLPDGSVALGVPAKIVSFEGKGHTDKYL